jgi:hypothetical protein
MTRNRFDQASRCAAKVDENALVQGGAGPAILGTPELWTSFCAVAEGTFAFRNIFSQALSHP